MNDRQTNAEKPTRSVTSELKPCPVCGHDAEMREQGNDYTNKRRVTVRCPECRIERSDAALRQSMDWLVGVAAKNWNDRPIEDALRAEVAETTRQRDELQRMLDAVIALEEPVERALRAEVEALKADNARYKSALAMDTPYRDQASALSAARGEVASLKAKLDESARLATDSAKQADSLAKDLAAANERAGRLEELRKAAWAMFLAIASGNGPFEKKMTRADMMEAARQAAESLEVPDAREQ